MTVSMTVRTAVPELDALTDLGIALAHAHNMPTITGIHRAVAVVSDRARDAGANDTEVYECFTTGLRGHTYLNAERDEQVVTAHLARALVYIHPHDLDTMLAIAAAIVPAVATDQALTEHPAAA